MDASRPAAVGSAVGRPARRAPPRRDGGAVRPRRARGTAPRRGVPGGRQRLHRGRPEPGPPGGGGADRHVVDAVRTGAPPGHDDDGCWPRAGRPMASCGIRPAGPERHGDGSDHAGPPRLALARISRGGRGGERGGHHLARAPRARQRPAGRAGPRLRRGGLLFRRGAHGPCGPDRASLALPESACPSPRACAVRRASRCTKRRGS